MKKISIITSILLPLAAVALLIMCGSVVSVSAQRDPFKKAGWATPKKEGGAPAKSGGSGGSAKAPAVPVNYDPPPIEARIEYYKRLRETAAANGAPLPKVTSVLTLGEMAVTGIFKTSRGYAAMIEATPIKLSYTIYPGEKFFDGQLVAVEENRLVFRKVTKTGEGKFTASVENKPLRQFTMRAQAQGTAPSADAEKPAETGANAQTQQAQAQPQQQTASSPTPVPNPNTPPSASASTTSSPVTTAANKPAGKGSKPSSNPFLSPLDEMNNLPAVPEKAKSQDKNKKPSAKPVKVAKNDGE